MLTKLNIGRRNIVRSIFNTMDLSTKSTVSGMGQNVNQPRFNRKLQPGEDVFSENKWSDFEWTPEMVDEAEAKIKKQVEDSSTRDDIQQIEARVVPSWNRFYKSQGIKAYKDRRWVLKDFPEIEEFLRPESKPCNILEIGCGIGSSIVHILENNQNPRLHMYCCDISEEAIESLKSRDIYQQNSDKITVFQADVCEPEGGAVSQVIPHESLDFINAFFTFSSLNPERIKCTTIDLVKYLKPGGMFLVRDYSRYDRNQLRFEGVHYISDDYYQKADGTTQFFPTESFIHEVFTNSGLEKVGLEADKNLVVNRKEQVKIFRCWIRAKYRKSNLEK